MRFSDLLVVELASVLAGPSVGQFFAELGATVLKVENVRTQGDVTRRWRLADEPDDTPVSHYFACCNWGKRSVALDLRHAEGQALLHRLVRRADVVLASYKPGDAERLGADYETLRRHNTALLYGSITGYGAEDPRTGYDAVVQAESGFTAMNGSPEGPPVKMPVALVDVLAAHQLKEALLVGLLHRVHTGEGGCYTVSLFDAAVGALANQGTGWLMAGTVPARLGSEHPSIVPYGTIYATADGREVVLAVGSDAAFAALCDVAGVPDLVHDPRFSTNPARVRNRAALHALLAERLVTWRRDALLARLHERHVPAGAVRSLPEVFAQPAAAALVLRDGTGARTDAGTAPVAGLRQAAFRPAPQAALAPPPRYAADTADVLRSYLDLDADALTRLAAAGVINTAPPVARGEAPAGPNQQEP